MVNNFCAFCGAKLECSDICRCPDAIEEQKEMMMAAAANAPPPPPVTRVNSAPPPPPPVYHQPQQEYQEPQQPTAQQYSVHIDAAKQAASALGGEAKTSLGAFIRSPLDTAATQSFSRLLSTVLLALDALLKAFFIERLVRAFMAGTFRSIAEEMGGGFEAAMLTNMFKEVKCFAFHHYLFLFLIMAAQTLFFAGLILILPKLTKGQAAPVDIDTAFGTAAVAEMPWIAATLVSSLLITFLSYSSTSVYLMLLLCGAAMVMSVYLLDAGIKKYIADDRQRMNILAISYGVQVMFMMIALFAFIPGRIVSAISQIM
jgi:hypothetical protein